MTGHPPGPRGDGGEHDRPDEDSGDHEALPDAQQVDDDTWSEFVDNLRWHASSAPEVTPDEIDDVLEDDWTPPDPGPVGWRTSSPSLVLGLIGSLGGFLAVLTMAMFVRPVPGWAVLVAVTVTVASALVLFSHMPTRRDPFSDGREV